MNKFQLRIAIKALLILSWALVFIGFFIGLYLFLPFGLISGLCAAFLCTTLGFTMILIVELYFIQKEKLQELKNQTSLLEKISNSLSKIQHNI